MDLRNDPNPFKFCGEYFDHETENYYLRGRYLNPRLGRFLTQDPMGDGLNWYTYANNNPIRFIDPTGYWAADGSDERFKDSNPVVYDSIGRLSDTWSNLHALQKNSTSTSQKAMITLMKAEVSALCDLVRSIGDKTTVEEMIVDNPLYNGLNSTEMVLFAANRVYGTLVGLSSQMAITDSQAHFGYREDGTLQNAFQHALWNAYAIAQGVSESYMKDFANAHEYGNSLNFGSQGIFNAVLMDLNNNRVGREWGKSQLSVYMVHHRIINLRGYMDGVYRKEK